MGATNGVATGIRGPYAAKARTFSKMTPAKFKDLVVKLGINLPDGSLATKYRLSKRKTRSGA